MKGSRCYSVHLDERNFPRVKYLRRKCGGIAAYGRYHVLMALLYDYDALIDLSDAVTLGILEEELELGSEQALMSFLSQAARAGIIDEAQLEAENRVFSSEVWEQLDNKARRSDRAKKG